MRLLSSLKNLFLKPIDEIQLVFEALSYLLIIKLLLKKYQFNDLVKRYSLHSANDEVLECVDTPMMKKIGWAVERTSLILPWDGLCLVKALSAQRMLYKRKLHGTIYMGVKKASDTKELEAHAWLCCNSQFLTGRVGHKEFTVVSKFTWNIDE